jgi:hypothetical protein
MRPPERPPGAASNPKLYRDGIRRNPGDSALPIEPGSGPGIGRGDACLPAAPGRGLRLRRCTSPKVFRNLKPGRYTFEVRVIGPVAPDATPARFSFRIPK